MFSQASKTAATTPTTTTTTKFKVFSYQLTILEKSYEAS